MKRTLVGAGLTLALVAGMAPASYADTAPGAAAGTWITGQTSANAGLLPGEFGPMFGPSIDAALSLQLLNVEPDTQTAITDAIAADINDYVTGEAFGDTGSHYAGALAKAAVLAQVMGRNDSNFGGVDLIADLEAQVADAAPIAGRIEDTSTFGDFANVLGQAYAARALTEANSSERVNARAFLVKQQCKPGWFRESFTADKSATGQSCVTASDTPSVDATAIAIINMQAVRSSDKKFRRALGKAKGWLAAQQLANGSWDNNANTTGLATTALGMVGNTTAANNGANWLRSIQVRGIGDCAVLIANNGAIALNANNFEDGLTTKISDMSAAAQQKWNFATAQAAGALAYAPDLVSALAVTNTSKYVKAGAMKPVAVTGAVAGGLCTEQGLAESVALRVGPAGDASFMAKMPGTTGLAMFTVTDSTGADVEAMFNVLGPLGIPVTVKRVTPVKGQVQRVKASGLAPGEKVRIYLGKRLMKKGLAAADGTFKARWVVKGPLGKKKVKVVGQFAKLRRGNVSYIVS